MVIHRLNPATTHFLNVDLDIYSKADLQPLVTALGKKVLVLYVGRIRRTHSAHLELAKITKTADATIRDFCSLIEALPKLERDLWNAANVSAGIKQQHSRRFCSQHQQPIGWRIGTAVRLGIFSC